MTLAIVILISATLLAAGFCLFLAVRTINDLNVICRRLDRMLDRAIELERKREMDSIIGDAFKPTSTTLHFKLVDDEEPLDFPNER